MTLIDLIAAVYAEAGISGTPPQSVNPAPTGEAARVLRWVKESWNQIQILDQGWRWLRATATVNTVANTQDYPKSGAGGFTGTTRFRAWQPYTARIYKQSLGTTDETPLYYLSYEDFLQRFLIAQGTLTNQRPTHFTIGPGDKIMLGPKPDDVYVVSIDFWKSNQVLANDSDVPEMPEDFHYAIVYRALMMYARFESAPEIYEDARQDFRAYVDRLKAEQIEPIEVFYTALVE